MSAQFTRQHSTGCVQSSWKVWRK